MEFFFVKLIGFVLILNEGESEESFLNFCFKKIFRFFFLKYFNEWFFWKG